jgi:hypothetical protein
MLRSRQTCQKQETQNCNESHCGTSFPHGWPRIRNTGFYSRAAQVRIKSAKRSEYRRSENIVQKRLGRQYIPRKAKPFDGSSREYPREKTQNISAILTKDSALIYFAVQSNICQVTSSGRRRYLEYLSTLEQVVRDATTGTKDEPSSSRVHQLTPARV